MQKSNFVSQAVAAPILAELLRYELLTVAEEMLVTMRRTTRSVLAREGADYGAAVLDAHGQIVAQAVPYGFMYFQTTVPLVIERYRGRLRPGDVVATNDPYDGGSHLPDIILIKPFFWDGQISGYTAIAQHHTDIGGRFPGGNGLGSETLFEEGLRLPAVKLYAEGIMNEAVREIIAANVRAPDDVLGDLAAALASCHRGETAVTRLLQKYGEDQIHSYWAGVIAQSEQYMRDIIGSFPDGTYRARSTFDDPEISVEIVVTMTVAGDELTFDLTGSSPQVDRAMNVPLGMITSMPIHVLLGFLGDLGGANLNSGLLRPITVIAPPSTVVNPTFPAPVGSRSQLYNRVIQTCRDCLVQAVPDIMPAAGEGAIGAIYASPGAKANTQFRMVTEFFHSGTGARVDKDGVEGVNAMMMSGFRTASSEVTESETAVALDGFGFVTDTAGAGEYRGTLSVFRRWRFLDHARVLVRDSLPGTAHRGRNGGGDSSHSRITVTSGGVETVLEPRAMHYLDLAPGDVLEYALPSGAGFGDPLHRSPAAVLADVRDGKVSAEQARDVYGVMIDADGTR